MAANRRCISAWFRDQAPYEEPWTSHYSVSSDLVDCCGMSLSFAQGPAPDAPTRSVEPASSSLMPRPSVEGHRFLDRQNCILFVAAAAVNGADFAVTRANLQTGGQELNPMVRPFTSSTPVLAVNFAAETAGVVGAELFLAQDRSPQARAPRRT